MKILKKITFLMLLLMPVFAFAHTGHAEQGQLGFLAGFTHPFTGLDHMMMSFALGVLFYFASKRWNLIGLICMVAALLVGFLIGQKGMIPVHLAEYGIVASLALLAVALWFHSKTIMPIATALLVTFHGVAHGVELGHSGDAIAVISGMLMAMSLLYLLGQCFTAFAIKYIPHGQKIVAVLTAIVAVFALSWFYRILFTFLMLCGCWNTKHFFA